MVKRSGRDTREGEDENVDSAERFRVDRVFVPRAGGLPGMPSPRPERQRTPSYAPPMANEDPELSLRRQLSRLQRQLADMQRDLAGKDEELAAEVEHRLLITAARDKLVGDQKLLDARIEEVTGIEAQVLALEDRLVETIGRHDELAEMAATERRVRETADGRVAELTAAIEEVRIRRIDERAQLSESHANELEAVEEQKREALASVEAAFEDALVRTREGHAAEVAELRDAHDRAFAALRGELEPHVLEARSLSAEREQLVSEFEALRTTAAREASERVETHRREVAQLGEAHARELAGVNRVHAAEVSKALGERDVEILEHQQTVRRAELRELQWEQTALAMRDAQKQVQTELGASIEKAASVAAERAALEERLGNAIASNERLLDEIHMMRQQLELADREARHAARERQRFVDWLRDGLEVLREPTADDETEIEVIAEHELEAQPEPEPEPESQPSGQ